MVNGLLRIVTPENSNKFLFVLHPLHFTQDKHHHEKGPSWSVKSFSHFGEKAVAVGPPEVRVPFVRDERQPNRESQVSRCSQPGCVSPVQI